MSDARLNVQGLCRNDAGLGAAPGLCSYILPDPGHVFVSIDLSAGEPAVTAHYSRDKMYCYATLDGVGKAPYWENERLFIDDIYIMVAASTARGRPVIDEAWNRSWGGLTFAEQWLVDPEVIKKYLGKTRKMFKTICLAAGYGLGVKKMGTQILEQYGVEMSEAECRDIHRGYWDTFSDVKLFSLRCQEKARKGYIVNEFGYRITFDNSGQRGKDTTHKAFNYLIQSSVSGIIHIFTMFLFQESEARGIPARLVTIIHDEDVVQVPADKVDLFREARDVAVTRLNVHLNWSVPIRTGFAVGATFFDAK